MVLAQGTGQSWSGSVATGLWGDTGAAPTQPQPVLPGPRSEVGPALLPWHGFPCPAAFGIPGVSALGPTLPAKPCPGANTSGVINFVNLNFRGSNGAAALAYSRDNGQASF